MQFENVKFSTLILSGGKSSRFGDDKAFAQIENISFLKKIVSTTTEMGELFISVNSLDKKRECIDHLKRSDIKYIIDENEGSGPLPAVINSLQHIKSRFVFVCPVDMPFLSKTDFTSLYSEMIENRSHLATYMYNGWLTSLFLLIDTNELGEILKFLQYSSIGGRVDQLIRLIKDIVVLQSEGDQMKNINSPEEIDSENFHRSDNYELIKISTDPLSDFHFNTCEFYDQELIIWRDIPHILRHIRKDKNRLNCD